MKFKLDEELFDDIVEIELPNSDEQIEVPTAPEAATIPSGPVTGEEIGQSSMLLDAISSCAKTIDNYNVIKANLTDSRMIEIMENISSLENDILGKLQGLLQQVSPNAAQITYGQESVESSLSESFNEGIKINIDDDEELINTLYDFIGELIEKYGVKAVVNSIKSIFPNLDWSLGESLNESVDNDYETYAEAVIDSIVSHYKDSEDLPDILRSFGRLVNLLARQSADKYELDIEYPANESLNEGDWTDETGKNQPSTLNYKGFKLRVDKNSLLNIYDSHGELVDYGFVNKKDAIDAIDSGKYDGLNESKLNEGDWEDPEWRKYYGVDDDSFYDPAELDPHYGEPEETPDEPGDFDGLTYIPANREYDTDVESICRANDVVCTLVGDEYRLQGMEDDIAYVIDALNISDSLDEDVPGGRYWEPGYEDANDDDIPVAQPLDIEDDDYDIPFESLKKNKPFTPLVVESSDYNKPSNEGTSFVDKLANEVVDESIAVDDDFGWEI